LPESILSVIDIFEIEEILSHPSLIIESEDWLCNYIFRRFEQNVENFSLFEFVEFEFLSTEVIQQFIELSMKCYEFMTFPIW
jgi:hypothetical protein